MGADRAVLVRTTRFDRADGLARATALAAVAARGIAGPGPAGQVRRGHRRGPDRADAGRAAGLAPRGGGLASWNSPTADSPPSGRSRAPWRSRRAASGGPDMREGTERAALPVAQGDHAGQEEADRRSSPSPMPGSTMPTWETAGRLVWETMELPAPAKRRPAASKGGRGAARELVRCCVKKRR